MVVHIRQMGDGLTVTIPEAMASQLGLEPHSPVDISLHGDALVIRPTDQPRETLADLLARVTEQNRHTEIDTGAPVGREVW